MGAHLQNIRLLEYLIKFLETIFLYQPITCLIVAVSSSPINPKSHN